MKSFGEDYDYTMEHASNSQLAPPCSADISNIVGAPKSNPRIGLEYQVEVPSMIKESERLKLLMNPADSELIHNEVEDSVAAAHLNNSWSDTDVKSFVLGLFIFGKNFVQIKRLLENKGMGEILSFYYGKFYKSDEYCRWSDCTKIKGRRCITRHKLFSVRKQRELLSRLTLHVSEEFKDALPQVFNLAFSKSPLFSVLLMNYNISKNLVLFLLPGVKKFSRRKLVKGDHYFDSVSDVLSKVIAEPNLLKLEVEETKVGGRNEEEAEKGSNKVDDELEEIYPDDEQVDPSKNSEASLNQPTTNEELQHALRKFRSLAYDESFKTCLARPNYKKELIEAIDELNKFEDVIVEEDKHELYTFVEIFDQAYPLSKQKRKCKEALEKIENDTQEDRSKLESLKSSYDELKLFLADLEKKEKDLEEQLTTIQDKHVTVQKLKDETITAKAKIIKKQKETFEAAKIIVEPLKEQLQKKRSLKENQAKLSEDLKVLIKKHNKMRFAHQP